MKQPQQIHFAKTAELARKLPRAKIYKWLVTGGYFPETYVLPPCYSVTKFPRYGKVYFQYSKKNFSPKITECQHVHFPKTELTDRTFGIIDPEIHSDIAFTISRNWRTI